MTWLVLGGKDDGTIRNVFLAFDAVADPCRRFEKPEHRGSPEPAYKPARPEGQDQRGQKRERHQECPNNV